MKRLARKTLTFHSYLNINLGKTYLHLQYNLNTLILSRTIHVKLQRRRPRLKNFNKILTILEQIFWAKLDVEGSLNINKVLAFSGQQKFFERFSQQWEVTGCPGVWCVWWVFPGLTEVCCILSNIYTNCRQKTVAMSVLVQHHNTARQTNSVFLILWKPVIYWPHWGTVLKTPRDFYLRRSERFENEKLIVWDLPGLLIKLSRSGDPTQHQKWLITGWVLLVLTQDCNGNR